VSPIPPASDNPTITTAEPDDQELLCLVRDLRADLASRHPELTDFSHRIPRPPYRSLLARVDGQAVGCCAVQTLADGAAELKRMYVRPEARRRGIAARLLTTAEDSPA
jgi:putative acetyltransferase